jgi:enoyl-CoA hydratase
VLGLTEVRAGIPFPAAAAAVVNAALSPPVARRLTLTGSTLLPHDALAAGVVDEIQPRETVLRRALQVAQDLSNLPSAGYARIKRQFRAAALAEIDAIVASGSDPLLDAWIDGDARSAAGGLLGREPGNH